MDNKVIIGLVGHPSSGKDTVAGYLENKYGFSHVSAGDLIRDYMKKNNMGEPERARMREVGNELRRKYGADYLVELAVKKDADRLLVSGVRTIAEANKIKEKGGVIVGLRSPIEFRYRLARFRGRAGDGSFKEFKKLEEKEARSKDTNEQDVEGVMKIADFTIDNDSTLEKLLEKIDGLATKLISKYN
ncbi:MAG: hypothetical protein A3G52_01320 [Candidatus Taylorbacteria bacterium RIFCSPLOWO2_12_FULL_43_20]|uniref:Dephospho-CoA kinase n=1 Tax=Candidatus Taylorbacteria bacterium RIFCSPLOWO2_12_FULL_43_20 TaxID=1802332 RepID=A0A1G2P3G2_9BACT|nr:MAG: hypothetical protein A2825_01265 [Candidatus Taylorbacteria bacterium RIFCSPHIGHO2_01_FULL_43_120]OHA22332.1 MAG: hypothetical protein A3B98_04440 [Candidatus Taylorbacteria bacterium RIFCSPHIGHO2_02_FULL_43_55]OHA30059.1 MAG: hypothetical protein A3E92_03400 [Candidatus Taylorbacteria bacterium RIFCSPHIGHO2_12_FULL_42_34]OHA32453.1 MAG: hypothetical protein A3B09_00025 [Candidatus Taylorbacteria bacterium RIFCSPLOWO2_01_FULL_43_83]OHA39540.1 MAG: hypothetical protein A3H58_02700 [Candi